MKRSFETAERQIWVTVLRDRQLQCWQWELSWIEMLATLIAIGDRYDILHFVDAAEMPPSTSPPLYFDSSKT